MKQIIEFIEVVLLTIWNFVIFTGLMFYRYTTGVAEVILTPFNRTVAKKMDEKVINTVCTLAEKLYVEL